MRLGRANYKRLGNYRRSYASIQTIDIAQSADIW